MPSIYQIASNVSLESGGQRTAVVSLNSYVNSCEGFTSDIITNEKELTDAFVEFQSDRFRFWSYAKGLHGHLDQNAALADIYHIHGVWMHTQYVAAKLAAKNQIPYVLTPHGMLQPWYLNDKGLKKKVYLNLMLRKILSNAKTIHAITPLERDNLFRLSNHKNIVEIPNFIFHTQLPQHLSYNPEEEYLLFLSRLHPGKGLDILIRSLSEIKDKKIKLKIAGSKNEYSEKLAKLSFKLGIQDRVEFVGAVYGEEKYALYANAKAFVFPSHSEAIGMVNLEAAICKTPVITTFDTGIDPGWAKNGGLLINPVQHELTDAINTVMDWPENERKHRGTMLSEFVIDNYSWEKKGWLWNDLYHAL